MPRENGMGPISKGEKKHTRGGEKKRKKIEGEKRGPRERNNLSKKKNAADSEGVMRNCASKKKSKGESMTTKGRLPLSRELALDARG